LVCSKTRDSFFSFGGGKFRTQLTKSQRQKARSPLSYYLLLLYGNFGGFWKIHTLALVFSLSPTKACKAKQKTGP
jgi:hypothetical protein